jgi:plasmid stability protein
MSQLILRNIPDEVRKTIKKQAIDKGISMQQHILNIIVEYIKKDKIIIVKEGEK